MKRVEFAPLARDELDAVRLIATFPEAGPPYPGIPSELQVRRRVVRGFPFVLAYRELGEMLRVDAVAHSRRRPGYWMARIKK